MNLNKSIENEIKERKTLNIVGVMLESNLEDMIIIEQNTRDIPKLPQSLRYFISKQDLVGDIKKLDTESVVGNQLYCVPVKKNADIQIQVMHSVKAGVSSSSELPVKIKNTSCSQQALKISSIFEGLFNPFCTIVWVWVCLDEPIYNINICYPEMRVYCLEFGEGTVLPR